MKVINVQRGVKSAFDAVPHTKAAGEVCQPGERWLKMITEIKLRGSNRTRTHQRRSLMEAHQKQGMNGSSA